MKRAAKEMNVMRFQQRMEGQEYELYLGAMSAEELKDKAKVDIYHAGSRPQGYQRDPTTSRYREIANYALRNEGLLPTAILVNIREEDGKTKFTSLSKAYGTLRIPADAQLWVVDGQHRLYGLQHASDQLKKHDPEASLGYDVPVVLTKGLTLIEEMRLFHIVNSKIRRVDTDLAAELLRRAVEKEGKQYVYSGKGSEKDFRKAVGTEVAIHLNSTPGPWRGKIRLPNEPKDIKRKPLQINAIASSLEPTLKDTYVTSIVEPETGQKWPTLRGIVFTYWEALSNLMPDAFADVEHYSVQRTAGAYAFHGILADVLYRCLERRDFSVRAFESVLANLDRWVKDETWHMESGDDATKATNMSALRRLIDRMRGTLPPLKMAGLPKVSNA